MPDKYFPIRTATACQLKWNWSTLYLYSGETASCHRTGWGNIDPENFDQFHNTEKKLQERRDMLDGKWPEHSCDYCRKIETAGGFSDRMLHLTMPNQSPIELETDPTAINVVPTILEVFFNNTCNLACLYCLPILSSKINQENIAFGKFTNSGIVLEPAEISNTPLLIDKFWNWMRSNSLGLKRFNVLGGEPFYQTEFYQLLDYFEENAHPDLELGIVTNLAIRTEKLDDICEKLKKLLINRKIKRIDITCSIDCWGAEQEYVRYGLELAQWQQNFEFLLSKKWIKLNINQTISVLTIKTMPELLSRLEQWRKIRPVGHFFSTVSPQPTYMAPAITGSEVFKQDFEKIIAAIPNHTNEQKLAIEYMKGIQTELEKSTVDLTELVKLKTFLNEKDRRRGTSWETTFPWLIEIFDQTLTK
jgi:organic radical activating enzyme